MATGAMPVPSAAPLTMPANSTSPELSAIVFCVVGQRFMVCTPRTQTPPRVDRRVRKRPAKSASTNARIEAPSACQGKL
eukprot:6974940-Alexandrium_andersonii.AAC.1